MSQPRTIAFFGSRRLLSELTPLASDVRMLIQGLQSRGFQLTFFVPQALERRQSRDESNWVEVTSFASDTEDEIQRALEAAAVSDIIIKSSCVGGCDDHLNRAVLEVAPPRTQVIYWDLNPQESLPPLLSNVDHPLRSLIPKYDLILTFGGGSHVVDAYEKLGARSCVPLYDGDSGPDARATKDAAQTDPDRTPEESWFEHRVRELEVLLRPAALQPLPA